MLVLIKLAVVWGALWLVGFFCFFYYSGHTSVTAE